MALGSSRYLRVAYKNDVNSPAIVDHCLNTLHNSYAIVCYRWITNNKEAQQTLRSKVQVKVKSIYRNHPSQGNSINYYIILGIRDKAAPPTSQQIGRFPPKRVKYQHRHPFVFFFLAHPQESTQSLISTNQRQGSSNWANVPRTCWAKLSGPLTQLRRSSSNTPNKVSEANVRPVKN